MHLKQHLLGSEYLLSNLKKCYDKTINILKHNDVCNFV